MENRSARHAGFFAVILVSAITSAAVSVYFMNRIRPVTPYMQAKSAFDMHANVFLELPTFLPGKAKPIDLASGPGPLDRKWVKCWIEPEQRARAIVRCHQGYTILNEYIGIVTAEFFVTGTVTNHAIETRTLTFLFVCKDDEWNLAEYDLYGELRRITPREPKPAESIKDDETLEVRGRRHAVPSPAAQPPPGASPASSRVRSTPKVGR